MENKANIIDDEEGVDDDGDGGIGKEPNFLEKSFEVGINNGAKCDYNWSSWGRKVQ